MNENPEDQKSAKAKVIDALAKAEDEGMSAAQLKELKAMMSVGQRKQTKKYPTPENRAARKSMQKKSRKANRK